MYGSYKDISQDFILDEKKLSKIDQIISDSLAKLDFETVTVYKLFKSDGGLTTLSSLQEVLEDDNSKKKRIERLTIEVFHKEHKDHVKAESLVFMDFDKKYMDRIHFAISSADRTWGNVLFDSLDEQVSRVVIGKFWIFLQRKTVQTFIYLFMSTIVSLYFYKWLELPVFGDFLSNSNSVASYTENMIVKLFTSCFIFITSLIVATSWKPLDGIATRLGNSLFLWGDVTEGYRKIVNAKNAIGYGLVVALLASILGLG